MKPSYITLRCPGTAQTRGGGGGAASFDYHIRAIARSIRGRRCSEDIDFSGVGVRV